MTSTSPACTICKALWVMRLSPGKHSTVSAAPTMRMSWYIGLIADESAP